MITEGTVLYKEPFVEISYNEKTKVIGARWIGYLKKGMVRTGVDKIREYMDKYDVSKHLSNQLELKILSKEVQDYLVGEIFPELERAGLRKVAVLVSDDVFAQVTVNKVNSSVMVGDLEIMTFSAYGSCKEWLMEA